MAKSSGPNLLTLLLVAGGAYVAYEVFFASAGATASSATPAPATPTGAAPASTIPSSAPAATSSTPAAAAVASAASSSTLDTQFNNMVSDATANGFSAGTPDQWGFYYAEGNPGKTAPTPESAGWNRQTNWPTGLTAAQYWTAASPLIAQAQGLHGLGFYGTLGALTRRVR